VEAELGLYIVLLVFAVLIGGTIAVAGGPYATSIIVDIAIIAYALLITSDPLTRHTAIALALGAHITAIIKYYSSPIPLPFIILERGGHGTTINIDIVQLTIAYEIIFERKTWRKLLKSLGKEPKDPGTRGKPP